MKILILTTDTEIHRESVYKKAEKADLIIKIRLDGTYDILKSRKGLQMSNLSYNEIHDTSPTNNIGKLAVKVQNDK